MQKSAIFLLVVGGLVAVGIILSFYGSQIVTKDLDTAESNVTPGNSLEFFTELDPEITQTGVYVVQTLNFQENSIHAKILDPEGSEIISKLIEKESFEGRFKIESAGHYTLIIENTGDEDTIIIGVIGHMPDAGKLSIGITGLYIVIMGLIGIIGIGIYAVKNKRRTNP